MGYTSEREVWASQLADTRGRGEVISSGASKLGCEATPGWATDAVHQLIPKVDHVVATAGSLSGCCSEDRAVRGTPGKLLKECYCSQPAWLSGSSVQLTTGTRSRLAATSSFRRPPLGRPVDDKCDVDALHFNATVTCQQPTTSCRKGERATTCSSHTMPSRKARYALPFRMRRSCRAFASRNCTVCIVGPRIKSDRLCQYSVFPNCFRC